MCKNISPEDKTVFQFTHPFRYTVWKDSDVFELEQYRYKKMPNYEKYKEDFIHTVERFVGNNVALHQKDGLDEEFIHSYYKKFNMNKEAATYDAIVEYVKNRADYSFFQVSTQENIEITDIDNVQDILGSSQYKRYCWDYVHFGDAGCEFVADVVEKRLGLTNNEIN